MPAWILRPVIQSIPEIFPLAASTLGLVLLLLSLLLLLLLLLLFLLLLLLLLLLLPQVAAAVTTRSWREPARVHVDLQRVLVAVAVAVAVAAAAAHCESQWTRHNNENSVRIQVTRKSHQLEQTSLFPAAGRVLRVRVLEVVPTTAFFFS